MQSKHLIIFALVGIAGLIVFNMSIARNASERIEIANNTVAEPLIAESYVDNSPQADIANDSLGQQPKAIIDKVGTDIEQAQQIDKERLASTIANAQ